MLTQYNSMTAKKLDEKRNIQEPSLRRTVIERNHKEASLKEVRMLLTDIVKEPAEIFRRPSLKEIK